MSTVTLIEKSAASPEVRAIFDEICAARGTTDVNNFWKTLAHDPATLRRTWDALKVVMAPGALDPVVKELIYVAVSVANGCSYCVHTHTAAARQKGLTPAQYNEFLAVVGMANQTNALVTALGVPLDAAVDASQPSATAT